MIIKYDKIIDFLLFIIIKYRKKYLNTNIPILKKKIHQIKTTITPPFDSNKCFIF